MTVRRLREYISNKYPLISPASRAGIFADAVSRIVAGKLPELPDDRISLFEAYLYGDAAKKQMFSINCSDIFKSSLKLKTTEEHFIKGLKKWLEDSLMTPVSEDKVFEYVHNVCSILDEYPDMDIEKVLDCVESEVGDIRPKKRMMSVIRINPPGKSSEEATVKECNGSEVNSNEAAGNEAAGEDWVVIRRRMSVREIIAGRISRLMTHLIGIYKKTAGYAADVISRRSGYRTATMAALAVAALLCTFLSALYVSATEKIDSFKADDVIKAEVMSAGFEYMGLEYAANGNETAESGGNSGEVLRMRATAYDLSVESCGKDKEHPEYGITYSGTRAEAGRTVAVDPEVIPLGSSIRIKFPEEYSYMDGMYVAEDTGRLIKGNNIDIFFGEDKSGGKEINKNALRFGVQYVDVEIIDTKQAIR
jgi:3D (Asp-Asp-Asp) domain-containing protein